MWYTSLVKGTTHEILLDSPIKNLFPAGYWQSPANYIKIKGRCLDGNALLFFLSNF